MNLGKGCMVIHLIIISASLYVWIIEKNEFGIQKIFSRIKFMSWFQLRFNHKWYRTISHCSYGLKEAKK